MFRFPLIFSSPSPRRRLASFVALLTALALPAAAQPAGAVGLNWLGGSAPAAPDGVTWGVPWPKGKLQRTDALALRSASGATIPVQSWPLAFWPDGSVKWTGQAIAASANLSGPFEIAPATGAPAAPEKTLTVTDAPDAVIIDAGLFRARIAKSGAHLIESLRIGDRTVAQAGRLVAQREDRSEPGVLRLTDFVSRIEHVTVEQSGPIRAVVKIEGVHVQVGRSDGREWLPFTVRLAFFAGSGAIHVTHSFVFDGDPLKDFIKSLGLAFDVPFQEELHNRHVRFASEHGLWAQPVRLLPGYRSQAGRTIGDLYAEHLAGQRIPNLAALDAQSQRAIETVPIWGDAKLTQLGAGGFSIAKRTTAASSWLHVTDGHRAPGLAVLADVSGGLAVGVKDFWQKHPASLEVSRAATSVGTLTAWFWSPDAPAMDVRTYDTVPHGLATNYEDWKPGWGTAHGVAHTHDLTLWAFAKIPSSAELVAMSETAAAPPVLVCSPEYYHAQRAFGTWSLPDRSSPALAWVEDQVGGLVDFYRAQVDERSWYGFWDFGDVMHNYDFGRHEWRYDVGGWAWANTELMPDLLLWYQFLRTGRADLYRMAEAMTRHTSEVDVHHVGPFAPLGSRHNVNHWGDGAKQPRVSHAALKRPLYFLSGGDGRLGDLLREQLDADLTYAYLQQFNGSHYILDPEGQPRLDRNARPAPRPEEFAPKPTTRQPYTRFGLEWLCYAANWTTEWERGGDQSWRPQVETAMKAMAANVDANGRFGGRYFDLIFGGPEILAELEPQYDIPEFWKAWANTAEAVGRATGGNEMTAPRLLAYAAAKKNSAELGVLAWDKLIGKSLPVPASPKKISSDNLARPVTDPAFLGYSVDWQLHGVASVQWALNALETADLARPWLADWEKSPKK